MNTSKPHRSTKEAGSIIVAILVASLFLTTIISGIIVLANANVSRAKGRVLLLQAQYAAESGVDSAVAVLNSGNESYVGSGSEVQILSSDQYRSTYSTTLVAGSNSKEKKITSIGKLYYPANSNTAFSTRTIEVIAQRSSYTSTSSIVSRNILDVESGVKNIKGRDVYINGYIRLNKNTTNLIADNITVADKNTGATNCSIGGAGNLLQPSGLATPVVINMAYNNCISPPGNVSGSYANLKQGGGSGSFTISANQTNINKIQSTLIPWSQYMDGTYQNSPTGCNDWSTGSSPRDIPRTGNTKKTHYPDSSSNVSASCGTSGDLSLGSNQYNIKDHVHVRANFCAGSACNPIFNNPDSTLKFIFVEGSVNFDSIRTTASSGPIALIAYGADPASKVSACPYGGAIFIGQGSPSNYTNAPDLYLLSSNGICMDKTKFGANPALGGISGKNIYIATSPGTPFDLGLDPTFPTSEIAVDLSWRAVRYRRL